MMRNSTSVSKLVAGAVGIYVAGLSVQGDHTDSGVAGLDSYQEELQQMQNSLDYLIECPWIVLKYDRLQKCCVSRCTKKCKACDVEITKNQYQDMLSLLEDANSKFAQIQESERANSILNEVATEAVLLLQQQTDDETDEVLPVLQLAGNSDDEHNKYQDESNFVDKNEFSSSALECDEELFLDVDSGDDDGDINQGSSSIPTKKKKKKKKRKKKTGQTTSTGDGSSSKIINETIRTMKPLSGKDQEKIDRLDAWLAKGAPLRKKHARETTLLFDAATVGHVPAAKALLDKPGIRVWQTDPNHEFNFTALHFAIENGHTQVVQLLLVSREIKFYRATWTPLVTACKEGNADMVKILLQAGADIDEIDLYGSTPLIMATESGHTTIVKILLEASADKDKPARNGFTALYAAAEYGFADIANILLEAGADPNKSEKSGCTPLYIGSIQGRADCVRILLHHGADKEKQSKDGSTPLTAASAKGRAEIVKILVDSGSETEKARRDGSTALLYACWKGHPAIVKILLGAGADMLKKTNKDQTAIDLAIENDHKEVVSLLLEEARARRIDIVLGDSTGSRYAFLQRNLEISDAKILKILSAGENVLDKL